MRKAILISEQDNIAALLENDRVCEFFVNRGELLLGDIYTCTVENILPGIDAAFVNLGKDKMGFLHANDVPGQGPLKERLVPKQKLLVQITKEPTGHKGPRVSTAISLPGRFLVLVPEERGVSISRRISESRERARLKAVVNLMKPPGVGLIIRTEAKGQGEDELFEDFQQLWDTWQTIVSEAEESIGPLLIYRDQDLLYRVIRDAYSHEVTDIIVDSPEGQRRAQEFLKGWASKSTKVSFHTGEDSLLVARGMDKEIELALTDRAELPSGGHLNIEPTEALTVIDVNSGRFTSSRTQAETVRRTNLEAAQEIPRQLRLRNIGGMVIVDFIDMESRKDQQQVLEVFQRALEEDRAKPQVGQLSDLGLVELTRRRQGQSLRELFTHECAHCTGQGVVPTLELTSHDGSRVIEFGQNDETSSRSSLNRGKSGAALKSASATQGRVVSRQLTNNRASLADSDDENEVVPEEILAQVPEDLLDDRETRLRKSRAASYDGVANEDEDNEESTELEPEPSLSTTHSSNLSRNTSDNLDDDEDLASELSRNISVVEEVYQEFNANRILQSDSDSQSAVESALADIDGVEVSADVMPAEEDIIEEVQAVEYELEPSPFAAVESNVSGVFTLKSLDSEQPSETESHNPIASENQSAEQSRAFNQTSLDSSTNYPVSNTGSSTGSTAGYSGNIDFSNALGSQTSSAGSDTRDDILARGIESTLGTAGFEQNQKTVENSLLQSSKFNPTGENPIPARSGFQLGGYVSGSEKKESYDQLKIATFDAERSETEVSKEENSDIEE